MINNFKPLLVIIFIIAIIIPCVVLGYLAIRAVTHEEAYIEKQLSNTSLSEINYVQALIQTELLDIEEELNNLIVLPNNIDNQKIFNEWKQKSPLVNVPFHLSRNLEILWPDINSKLSEDELSFLNWNKDFLKGNTPTPIYMNIALAYKDQIIKNEPIVNKENDDSVPIDSKEKINEYQNKKDDKVKTRSINKDVVKSIEQNENLDINKKLAEQQAIKEFYDNESLKEEVYKKAENEGKKINLRNIISQEKNVEEKKQAQSEQEKSIYISELLKIDDIIKDKDHGIIPRILYDELTHIFWKKTANGNIIGCVIDKNQLNNRILSSLPDLSSTIRIITILNDNGIPLFIPKENNNRDWRKPFVAREISELLPHWEIAVYLINPDFIENKADFMKSVVYILITLMSISILFGSILIIRSIYLEINLARKKTTFVANVSHELKTPLTSIRMFAEILKEKRQTDEKKKNKYLEIMVSETERLTRLINNVLDFSKINERKKKYNKKNMDCIKLCKNISESQKVRLIHNGFIFNFNTKIKEIFIYADEEAMKQVILNIISNAEKYSIDRKEIILSVFKDNCNVFIQIEDRGIGIPSKHVNKIFKEFYRIDDTLTSKVKGTGLGLTIAQKIINDHNGNIIYKPRIGGGSVFQIILPVN